MPQRDRSRPPKRKSRRSKSPPLWSNRKSRKSPPLWSNRKSCKSPPRRDSRRRCRSSSSSSSSSRSKSLCWCGSWSSPATISDPTYPPRPAPPIVPKVSFELYHELQDKSKILDIEYSQNIRIYNELSQGLACINSKLDGMLSRMRFNDPTISDFYLYSKETNEKIYLHKVMICHIPFFDTFFNSGVQADKSKMSVKNLFAAKVVITHLYNMNTDIPLSYTKSELNDIYEFADMLELHNIKQKFT